MHRTVLGSTSGPNQVRSSLGWPCILLERYPPVEFVVCMCEALVGDQVFLGMGPIWYHCHEFQHLHRNQGFHGHSSYPDPLALLSGEAGARLTSRALRLEMVEFLHDGVKHH